ncbi:hypothetical protein SJAV_27250 [Sulfurisphaera javensis]|uniref:Uncharacterized protein n=1 Tax=Sulfurisphaera javensis TaxID=2049879 RepID=A0AAT9GVC9_9CREN
MIWKIVKLKLKTRFSIPLIIANSLIIAVYVITAFSFRYLKETSVSLLALYLLMFFFLLTIQLVGSIGNPAGPLLYDKSDFDFLFTIPADKKDFALAFFIFSIILNLLTFSLPTFIFLIFIMGVYSLPFVISLAISFTTLNVITNKFSKYRWIIILVIELWFLSFLFKFPLSPLSVIYGDFIGYYTYIAFSILTIPFYFKYYTIPTQLNVLVLGGRRKEIAFSSSIFMSMLKKNIRIAGHTGLVSVNLRGYLILSSILSVIYYVFEDLLRGIPIFTIQNINIGVLIVNVSLLFNIMVYSQFSLVGEAVWIYITVMDERTFIRYYIASKLIPLYLVTFPLIVVSSILGNIEETLLILSLPLFFITLTYTLMYSPIISKQGIVMERITLGKTSLFGLVLSIYMLLITVFFMFFPLYVILFIVISNLALLFVSWRKAIENYIMKEI